MNDNQLRDAHAPKNTWRPIARPSLVLSDAKLKKLTMRKIRATTPEVALMVMMSCGVVIIVLVVAKYTVPNRGSDAGLDELPLIGREVGVGVLNEDAVILTFQLNRNELFLSEGKLHAVLCAINEVGLGEYHKFLC